MLASLAMANAMVADRACPHCEGRGWILQQDGGAGTARPCDCRKKAMIERLLGAAGLPQRYRDCTLENFKTSDPEPAKSAQLQRALKDSRQYVEGFLKKDGTFRESGLIFVGRPGTGKTHLASAVLKELIATYQVAGRFVDFTTLVHQIQATFEKDATVSKSDVLGPVTRAPLLVLDELGAQKPTPWVQDLLYLLINTRYGERRPTLFTTNYSLDEPRPRDEDENLDRPAPAESRGLTPLARRIQAPLVSRLCEMAKPVLLDSVEDFRRSVKMEAVRRGSGW